MGQGPFLCCGPQASRGGAWTPIPRCAQPIRRRDHTLKPARPWRRRAPRLRGAHLPAMTAARATGAGCRPGARPSHPGGRSCRGVGWASCNRSSSGRCSPPSGGRRATPCGSSRRTRSTCRLRPAGLSPCTCTSRSARRSARSAPFTGCRSASSGRSATSPPCVTSCGSTTAPASRSPACTWAGARRPVLPASWSRPWPWPASCSACTRSRSRRTRWTSAPPSSSSSSRPG